MHCCGGVSTDRRHVRGKRAGGSSGSVGREDHDDSLQRNDDVALLRGDDGGRLRGDLDSDVDVDSKRCLSCPRLASEETTTRVSSLLGVKCTTVMV